MAVVAAVQCLSGLRRLCSSRALEAAMEEADRRLWLAWTMISCWWPLVWMTDTESEGAMMLEQARERTDRASSSSPPPWPAPPPRSSSSPPSLATPCAKKRALLPWSTAPWGGLLDP